MTIHENIFTKEERICNETEITRLFEKGESFISYPIRVVWIENNEETTKIVKVLISVSKKKLRHAVDRNRVKRLVREAYRLNKTAFRNAIAETGKSLSLCFIWLPSDTIDFKKVKRKMTEALVRISQKISNQSVSPDNEKRKE